jgi:hypothetical protein
MFRKPTKLSFFDGVIVVVCMATALYHLAGIFYPVDLSPAWRHAVFIVVTLFSVWAWIQKPFYLHWFLLVLFIQQCYSHGGGAIRKWNTEHRIGWLDIAVITILAILLFKSWNDKYRPSAGTGKEIK